MSVISVGRYYSDLIFIFYFLVNETNKTVNLGVQNSTYSINHQLED